MSWKAGSKLFDGIIEILNNCDVEDDTRKLIYEELITLFEDQDCDTLDECVGEDKVFDLVWKNYEAENKEENDPEKEEWEEYE